jgi:hydroxymethylpyrimidine/phosphomethylpyrimidine kinase
MQPTKRLPIALTIAGSDSGGGAGIQADLKTFAALGVHGTTAITCLTAQNPRGVRSIQAAQPRLVRDQIAAVFAELRPAAVKTGMLFSAPVIRAVAAALHAQPRLPLVIDPVMVATSGARLLQTAAIKSLTRSLFPLATLLTPNLDEAAILLGRPIRDLDDLRPAAHDLFARFGVPILLKGGHLRGLKQAVDLYLDGHEELLLEAPFIKGVATHGTGCTYSAAITGYLALGCTLPHAVQLAKNFVSQAIAQHQRARRHDVLNPFWQA